MERPADNRRLGRYELRDEIGRGGMAVVYRAFDTVLERSVALKLLHPHLANDKDSRARFRREAQSVARLKHPNVLEIHDFSGTEDTEEVYIVMELIEGTTLRRFLDEREGRKLSPAAAALIAHRVAAALSHAHQNGIVHRDVKPENILISSEGVPKLSDFGIAHLVGRTSMTHTGQILGSPAYMSPEHLEHGELDARADLFSLGTVLYEMVTGQSPFAGKNPHAVIKRIIQGEFIDPLIQEPSVGRGVAEVIRRCLQTRVAERYQNAAAVAADLESVLNGFRLAPSEETLSAFFDDPLGWTAELRPRIIASTLTLAAAARKAGQYAAASEHLNCVLAMEPGNPEALSALVGMSRSRRMRKILERTAVILPLLVVLLAGGWSMWGGTEPDDEIARTTVKRSKRLVGQNQPRTAVHKPPAEKAAPPLAPVKEPESTADTTAPPRPNSGKAAAAALRKVVFTPHPMAVRITIDNKESFDFGPTQRSRELPVGKHAITFTPLDPKRFEAQTWSVDVPPGVEPWLIRERLRLRPATLLVKSNREAEVTVPGRAAGRTNAPLEVELDKGPEELVSLLVSAPGYASRTRQVTLSAGEQTNVTVLLERTEEVESEATPPKGVTAPASP